MTRTVLLVSELGIGMGHAMRLLAIAKALKSAGMTPVAAMRELWVCTDQFRNAGVPVIQAPAHRGQWPSGNVVIHSYADMSAACGFHSVDALWPMVLGWDTVFDLVGPSVVVTDYSPLATLAAFDRYPIVAIGDGFVLAPPNLPRMPALRAGGSRMASEEAQLQNAATVLRRLDRHTPSTLPQLIGGTSHVVCTYPELDIYDELRQQPALGSLLPVPGVLPAPQDPRIFSYLSAPSPMTASVMKAMIETGVPVEAYIRDAGSDMKNELRAHGAFVHDQPPELPEMLRRSTLVVHHGGIGTLETCLAAGRDQLLVPSQFEQTLNAKNAVARGLALSILKTDTIESLSEKARGLAQGVRGLPNIGKAAASIAQRDGSLAMRKVIEACASL